ncbi:uncharacterized protein [Montipora capricornis]|uniref:uncharacterized protein n=1 Tax=Montipora capricornis TaxID=246305 RepID=UPI0035F11D3D
MEKAALSSLLFIYGTILSVIPLTIGSSPSWMNVGNCGEGLTCGMQCQLLCLKMHNYYRELHGSPSLECDPNLAKSAQDWTDKQASNGSVYHSPWTDQYTESISWKGDKWEGMDSMNGSIPGAVRSWYSEIKNGYNYETGKSAGLVGHFQAVVWKGEKKIGCGLNIKEGHGTYVTVHYFPASHAYADRNNHIRENVAPRREPEPSCDLRSSERIDCFEESATEDKKVPFITPQLCISSGCCYDDMFMKERSVKFYAAEGRKWCFKPKGLSMQQDNSGNTTASPTFPPSPAGTTVPQ